MGREYRGRGYSRDAMPRVMTYGFAPEPAGLGMHRIWVSVPEKNSRSISVYQSLGFVPSGTSRDALWDVENNKYQDLIVMDTLVDEYDPIRSLDAFGMHLIEDNPGVKEALSAREHSIAIQQNKPEPEPAQRGEAAAATTSDVQSQALDAGGRAASRATGRAPRRYAEEHAPQSRRGKQLAVRSGRTQALKGSIGGVRWAAAANAIRKVSE